MISSTLSVEWMSAATSFSAWLRCWVRWCLVMSSVTPTAPVSWPVASLMGADDEMTTPRVPSKRSISISSPRIGSPSRKTRAVVQSSGPRGSPLSGHQAL